MKEWCLYQWLGQRNALLYLISRKNPDAKCGEQGVVATSLQMPARCSITAGTLRSRLPESGFSVTKSVEWLSTSALRQCLQCSFCLFVSWTIFPVCLGLRSLLRGRIFSTKTGKALGKFGQLAPFPSGPTASPISLASCHRPTMQWASQQLCSLFPGALHTGAWWLLISHSAISNSLWPHGLQHARLPCPSPSPRVCPDSCPLSRWCHPTISSPSPPAFNLSQAWGAW